jgi:hypothetical protein
MFFVGESTTPRPLYNLSLGMCHRHSNCGFSFPGERKNIWLKKRFE